MSLKTGTNTVKIELIDNDNNEVAFSVSWNVLDYGSVIELQEAIYNATIALGKQRLAAIQSATK